ncbi:MAG: LacI family DNA-binding transcriptional regulator [Sediminicola sp.]|tara:strand:+ start:6530 stop:7621 length:1092 start_codon:yes stop_codon:yes gene_type:complete
MTSKKINQSIKKFRKEILNEELQYGHLLPSEKQLAEQLQLSRPTVSKIYDTLRNEGLIQKKQGFGTSVIYRKTERKYTFGLLFPGAGESEIFGKISDYFLDIESNHDVQFLWDGAVANNAQIRKSKILDTCKSYLEKKVDGIFFAPLELVDSADSLNNQICKLIDGFHTPVVLIDRDIYRFPERSEYTVVGLDNYKAGYSMTQHLIDNGCTTIYLICRRDSASSVYKRIVGCRSSCFDNGINFSKDNIIIGDPADSELLTRIQVVSGKTGILCINDATAAVAMSTFDRLGIVISKDILIAGFDDMKYARLLQMPLTSYKQPLSDITKIAYETMISRVTTNNRIRVNLDIEGRIIARESTRFNR